MIHRLTKSIHRFRQNVRDSFAGRRVWSYPIGLWRLVRCYKWWQAYLALLVLSLAVKLVFPGNPYWPNLPNESTIQVQRFDASGPVDGPPVTLGYREYGNPNAPAKVICLHGSPAFYPNFLRLGPQLAEADLHVIAIDYPGFGRSSAWVPDYGLDTNARYMLAAMDEMKIDRAHLLGYSLGSGVALEMFDAQPDRVESLIFYGGIGIQEGEGTGDYHFEHFKYAVGYAVVVVGMELIPDFGLGVRRSARHAFIRSFYDSDQRPLRRVLHDVEAAGTPMLIVQDFNDPLVPADTAREHHDIVEHSELVMQDHAHGGVFREGSSREIAEVVADFVQRVERPGYEPTRRTVDPYAATAGEREPENPLPFGLELDRRMSPWAQVGAIVVGTYFLEDPTTVFVGLLVAAGKIDFFLAVMAVFFGIFSGDLLLYLFGWVVGKRALRWEWVHRRMPTRHVERLGEWFDTHGWSAVLASRFLPGTRLPLYIAAGALGKKPGRFAIWTCLAVLIWAPTMIVIVVVLGTAAKSPLRAIFGDSWLVWVVAVVVVLAMVRVIVMSFTKTGRRRLRIGAAKIWRWEYWPVWFFYLPVLPWIAWLAVRYRGLATLTAVNPGIPHSGFVGESKSAILNELPDDAVVPWAVVPRRGDDGSDDARLAAFDDIMAERGWGYPLILKPDEGQRGLGLRKADDRGDVVEYFSDQPGAVLVQTYHLGPHEAGIFYYRLPDAEAGRIYSITHKKFPVVVGDGKHTLEELIWRHPRYRMQAGVFLKRFGDQREWVPGNGEAVSLAVAGNHCQGTMFLDGSHLITPELERRVDAVAAAFDGFYFGRFDVRYSDVEKFKRGEDLAIVELNGITSESTNIYDPEFSLLRAYRVLWRQWSIAFEIGRQNRQRGAKVTGMWELLGVIRAHYRKRETDIVTD